MVMEKGVCYYIKTNPRNTKYLKGKGLTWRGSSNDDDCTYYILNWMGKESTYGDILRA